MYVYLGPRSTPGGEWRLTLSDNLIYKDAKDMEGVGTYGTTIIDVIVTSY